MLVQYEFHDAIATITLNRPDKLNAFGGSMRDDLLAALRQASADASCRAVVLTGAGRAFCAGGDVEWMRSLKEQGDPEPLRGLLDAGREIILEIATMPKAVVARVNGVAAGAGCNLAIACDYRIAASTARFGESFTKIGLHPDWGGTWFLPRLIGRSRAFELFMSGRLVDAPEALSLGLVDQVVDPAELDGAVRKVAEAFASAPPLAVAGIKRALLQSDRSELRDQMELENEIQMNAFRSHDAMEGLKAFFEKRPPKFEGK